MENRGKKGNFLNYVFFTVACFVLHSFINNIYSFSILTSQLFGVKGPPNSEKSLPRAE